jgi:small subunit ribosomal protein S6
MVRGVRAGGDISSPRPWGGVERESKGRVESMARKYETAFILSPNLDEAGIQQAMTKVGELVTREAGTVGQWDTWGKRRLAYEIKGETDGYYTFLTFEADPPSIERLGQAYRLSDDILRHLTICLEE